MHGIGDCLVATRLAPRHQHARKRFYPAGDVGREAAGDHQADTAPGALGKVGGEPIELVAVLETRVHRSHQDAIPKRHEAEVERREQMRVRSGGRSGCHGDRLAVG